MICDLCKRSLIYTLFSENQRKTISIHLLSQVYPSASWHTNNTYGVMNERGKTLLTNNYDSEQTFPE